MGRSVSRAPFVAVLVLAVSLPLHARSTPPSSRDAASGLDGWWRITVTPDETGVPLLDESSTIPFEIANRGAAFRVRAGAWHELRTSFDRGRLVLHASRPADEVRDNERIIMTRPVALTLTLRGGDASLIRADVRVDDLEPGVSFHLNWFALMRRDLLLGLRAPHARTAWTP